MFRDRVVIRVPKYNDRLYSILMYKGSLYVVTGNIISFACVGGGVASSLLRVSSNPCQKKERGVRALTPDACANFFFFSFSLFAASLSGAPPALRAGFGRRGIGSPTSSRRLPSHVSGVESIGRSGPRPGV